MTNDSEEPRLLAGGNPQIPKGDGDAPVQAYIAAMPGWKRAVGEELDAIIVAAAPDVVKAVKWNQPLYGTGGDEWFVSFRCFTRHVKVSFFRGAALDPPPPGVAKDPDLRSFDVREGEPIDVELVTSWVRQACALPGVRL